ncbi:MAG: SAM-dependent methyltransferase, partial [Polyangia bacterium]
YGSISKQIRNEDCYLQRGIAFNTIGSAFSARKFRYAAVFSNAASSIFGENLDEVLCCLNRTESRFILESLNPTVNFQVGDVNRLPLSREPGASQIAKRLDEAFSAHESARESSVEFKRPGPSPWRYAQDWAQRAVDRPDGAPLPPYQAEYDPPEPAAFVSFAVGVALGRFGGNGEGILDGAPHPNPLPGSAGAREPEALPHGILFLGEEGRDSLEHPACAVLLEAWKEHGAAVGEGDDLRTYLQRSFFDWHKRLYENRPIYFPLSSARRSYVAFVSIHRFAGSWGDGGKWGDGGRWGDSALNVLLADHLLPERRRLEGELDDIRKARTEAKGRGKAERRFAEVSKLLEELSDFIAKVTEVAEHGPPAPDDKTPKREQDARFAMDLDDGVMVNSAALWPLLESQWKDPKKWWKELATAQGRKDYDWSHLTAHYFPSRVREKCVQDPSLAVAHHCFWELHPAKAYAWELRLQDEIRPDFTIDEPDSFQHRAAFLKAHPEEVEAAQTKEAQRRARKAAKTDDDTDAPLLDRTEGEEASDA